MLSELDLVDQGQPGRGKPDGMEGGPVPQYSSGSLQPRPTRLTGIVSSLDQRSNYNQEQVPGAPTLARAAFTAVVAGTMRAPVNDQFFSCCSLTSCFSKTTRHSRLGPPRGRHLSQFNQADRDPPGPAALPVRQGAPGPSEITARSELSDPALLTVLRIGHSIVQGASDYSRQQASYDYPVCDGCSRLLRL